MLHFQTQPQGTVAMADVQASSARTLEDTGFAAILAKAEGRQSSQEETAIETADAGLITVPAETAVEAEQPWVLRPTVETAASVPDGVAKQTRPASDQTPVALPSSKADSSVILNGGRIQTPEKSLLTDEITPRGPIEPKTLQVGQPQMQSMGASVPHPDPPLGDLPTETSPPAQARGDLPQSNGTFKSADVPKHQVLVDQKSKSQEGLLQRPAGPVSHHPALIANLAQVEAGPAPELPAKNGSELVESEATSAGVTREHGSEPRRETLPAPALSPPPTVQFAPLAPQTLMATSAATTLDDLAVQPLSEGHGLGIRALSAPFTMPLQAQTLPYARAQAAHVAPQIAAAVTQATNGTTEIALNPEELGRVRITLSSGDAGLTVSILAERPETADLMRRHLDVLAREFREMGHDGASFNFEDQPDQPDDTRPKPTAQRAEQDAPATADPASQSPVLRLGTGLDLKL